jgi:putative phosphoribosyl transferase
MPLWQMTAMFADRHDAGRRLAAALARFRGRHPVVLAIPRGGVPVAFEIARALDAPLDLMVTRKLGAPGQPELGIGALADGDHPEAVLNPELLAMIDVSETYLRAQVERELEEIHRRQKLYCGGRVPAPIEGTVAILVDDGIATGGSIRAAIRSLKRRKPARIVVAVPVAPAATVEALKSEADEVVALTAPETFGSVGEFYRDFAQTSDEEVVSLLDSAHRRDADLEQGAPRPP